MKVGILRFWVRVLLQGRLYYLWSRLYQATHERWAASVRLPAYGSIKLLVETLSRMRWIRDGAWELGDAIGGARATYAKHAAGKAAGDCDDISLYAADRIRDMARRGVLKAKGVRPDGVFLLTVPWVDGEGEAGGHNVCAFRYDAGGGKVRWAHASNWHRGKVQWGNGSLKCVVRNVLKGRVSLGWALVTPDLRLVRFGSGRNL